LKSSNFITSELRKSTRNTTCVGAGCVSNILLD